MSPLVSWLLVLGIIVVPVLFGIYVERRRRQDARLGSFFAALRADGPIQWPQDETAAHRANGEQRLRDNYVSEGL